MIEEWYRFKVDLELFYTAILIVRTFKFEIVGHISEENYL
jgi:hypothetical protein